MFSGLKIFILLASINLKFFLFFKIFKDLLSKHEAVESEKREQLEEKVAFYEKEFNINPLSWGKKKKKK